MTEYRVYNPKIDKYLKDKNGNTLVFDNVEEANVAKSKWKGGEIVEKGSPEQLDLFISPKEIRSTEVETLPEGTDLETEEDEDETIGNEKPTIQTRRLRQGKGKKTNGGSR